MPYFDVDDPRPCATANGTVDDLERTHIEHVAARRRARQAVIHEIEERLLDLIRMRELEREVAAKRGRERLRMTQRTHDRAERGERGVRRCRDLASSRRGCRNESDDVLSIRSVGSRPGRTVVPTNSTAVAATNALRMYFSGYMQLVRAGGISELDDVTLRDRRGPVFDTPRISRFLGFTLL